MPGSLLGLHEVIVVYGGTMLSFLLLLADLEDHEKIEYVYTTYHRELLKYARNILKPSQSGLDEEDAVQNMYVSLIQYVKTIRCWHDERQLHAYLLKMTFYECMRLQKKAVYHEDLQEYENVLVSDADFIAKVNEEEDYRRLVQKILDLDEKYSIPMHLYWVEELDIKEISKRLDMPVKTVYTRLNRGKMILMKLLEREAEHATT